MSSNTLPWCLRANIESSLRHKKTWELPYQDLRYSSLASCETCQELVVLRLSRVGCLPPSPSGHSGMPVARTTRPFRLRASLSRRR